MKKIIVVLCIFIVSKASAQIHPDTTEAVADTRTFETDSSELYGLIPELPVKVGGGPSLQRAYLESLRDAKGKQVTYERKGSCCPYKTSSPKAIMELGMLDKYEITYRDESNKKKKMIVFITFYDFEELKPIKGFTFKE